MFFFFFKQKTAYEVSACLVGSEMCIRDSSYSVPQCGQTLNTATGSSSAGVDCRASNPDPNPLSASARASASRMARSSSEALGGGERSSELSCSSADIDIEYARYPLARKVVPQTRNTEGHHSESRAPCWVVV